MAYTTGSAADMAAVKTALVNACTTNGWTEQTDAGGKTVLSNNGIYVRIEAFTSYLTLLGRTSLDAGDSPQIVKMDTIDEVPIAFPVTYFAFVFASEVFFIINYSDKYQWCAFGQSQQNGLPGTGNWVAASCGSGEAVDGIRIYSSGSFNTGYGLQITSAALFWMATYDSFASPSLSQNCWHHNNLESSYPWALSNGTNYSEIPGISYLEVLLDTQPNDYNLESVFLPIRAYKERLEDKVSQVGEIVNARHIRIDNYSNEQIITMGTDDWMVFPWYRRNAAARNGGSSIDHTGTFGWAIKKE